MPNTYKKIASVVVGSGGSSAINFTSIPQTFTDLKIVISSRDNRSGAVANGINLSFNSSTLNFTSKVLYGTGSTTSSYSPARYGGTSVSAGATSSVFASTEIYIPNYTSANYKSYNVESVVENNATESYQYLGAGLWSDNSAITSITLNVDVSASFVQHTTATLYGIGDVTASKFAKATGGLITYDSTYVYHTFTSSGIFSPNTALTADYLVIAGGGGGGGGRGGGGGAGGYRTGALSLTSGAKTVTVGGGGAAGYQGVNKGVNGSDSIFDSITSTGGGGGGSDIGLNPGANGGSGGGANGTNEIHPGGTGVSGQGFAGGSNGTTSSPYPSAGGGGASAVGGNGSGSTSGSGGAGSASSITGISVTRAGGGGGGRGDSGTAGTGGVGGGGNGSNNSAIAGSGTTNTGGGGGGGTYTFGGGAGGSGIVIIRYTR
jgi:hypothetical protein